jgi:hypothetical protein
LILPEDGYGQQQKHVGVLFYIQEQVQFVGDKLLDT